MTNQVSPAGPWGWVPAGMLQGAAYDTPLCWPPREVGGLKGLPATSLSTILHQSFFEQCRWGP